MSSTPHDHCWHTKSSYTNGLGTGGADTEQCCHCGAVRNNEWKSVKDPAHGPLADINIKVHTFTK